METPNAPSGTRRWRPAALLAAAALTLGVAACAPAAPRSTTSTGTLAGLPSGPAPAAGCSYSAKLVPSCGVWWGAAVGAYTAVAPEIALSRFERMAGRPSDVFHAYHRDSELFPTATEQQIALNPSRPRLLFLNWKPDLSHSWAQVAAGAADARIDALAAHIKATFPHPFFLTVWHEPENDVRPTPGSGFTAADYAAMYRHVVQRLRQRGATKVVTVMSYMGWPAWGTQPWFGALWPGDSVVDWISQDSYADDSKSGVLSGRFADMVDRKGPGWPGFYTWATRYHGSKPFMQGEWGVFDHAHRPDAKAAFFDSVATQLPRFPKVRAMFYFDSPDSPEGSTTADVTPATAKAFRHLSNIPYVARRPAIHYHRPADAGEPTQ